MRKRTLEAVVNFQMEIRENETYAEARERFIHSILNPTIRLKDHIVDWEIEYCEEKNK